MVGHMNLAISSNGMWHLMVNVHTLRKLKEKLYFMTGVKWLKPFNKLSPVNVHFQIIIHSAKMSKALILGRFWKKCVQNLSTVICKQSVHICIWHFWLLAMIIKFELRVLLTILKALTVEGELLKSFLRYLYFIEKL